MSNTLRTVLMLAVVASFSLVTACGGSDPVPQGGGGTAAPAAQTKKVVMWQYRLNPASLTINAGDTVVFENKDPEPHNVNIAALNVDQNVEPGSTWSYTFNAAGEYSVGNRLATNPMTATIIVQ
jgi:plastocyanin